MKTTRRRKRPTACRLATPQVRIATPNLHLFIVAASTLACLHRGAAFAPPGSLATRRLQLPSTIQHHRNHAARAAMRAAASPAAPPDDPMKPPSATPPPIDAALDYLNAIRPVTIVQAVGALIVGRLALLSGQVDPAAQPGRLLAAAAAVYLSYGAGMVMNDCVDVDADSLHDGKRGRAIASGRISTRAGWAYCAVLSVAALLLGWRVGSDYAVWSLSNLVLMLGYALGLQRVFLVKNALCGWLAVSPLVGAALLSGGIGVGIGAGTVVGSGSGGISTSSKLWRLAAVGFPMHVSREILKDIEDVDVDRGNKSTLPLVVGERAAHRIAYGIVAAVSSLMIFTPLYWGMFASKYPIYPIGVLVGLPMCMRASALPLSEGQRLLKKSIYVLLAGMIGGLLAQ